MAEPRTEELTDKEHAVRERVEAKLGEPPERWKAIEDYTPADHEARHRGERVESKAYREYERQVRRAAGLEDDAEPKPLEEMTPEDHARRRYGDAA